MYSPIQSAKHLGERLRAARNTSGLSSRAVARHLQEMGIPASHATVTNYEVGKSMPPLAVVTALANIYGRSPEWFLETGLMLSGVRYRCLKSVRVSDKRLFEGHALGWLHAYLQVESVLDRTLPSNRVRISLDRSGEFVAERIRKKFSLGQYYPIPSVIRLAENLGIRVIQVDSDARIDAFAAHLGEVPVVVLNSRLSNDRIRLNAAHEVAHHVFEDCARDGHLSEEEIERRAFECASHLLIPHKALVEAFELKSMVRLVQYKERFGISLAAMIYRAQQERLIPPRICERLWRDFSRLGWRKHEPGRVPADRPVRMEALFDAAVRTDKMTYTEIARLAAVDEVTVRQRVLRAMGGFAEEGEGASEPVYDFEAYRDDESL